MKNHPQRWFLLTALMGIGITVPMACQKKDSEPPPDLTPVITSFSPAEAPEGGTVVITGKNFAEAKENNEVKFNGTKAAVTAAKPTELTVVVPENATSGKITLTIGDKTVTSGTGFKVNPTAPAIASFSPEKGEAEVEVTITGTRFANDSKVYFGGVEATVVTFVSKTSLKAKVPADALTGKLKVTAGTLEAVSAADFKAAPRITNFTADAEEGQEVTITGANFSTVKEENIVHFGTGQATAGEIIAASATELKVKAPVAGTDGQLAVAVAGLTAVTPTDFTYRPTITGFAPDHGPRSTPVTITGKRISASNLAVKINGINASVQSHDATMVKVKIPNADAVIGGKFQVLSKGFTLQSPAPFIVTNILVPKKKSPYNNLERERPVSFVLNNKLYVGWGRANSGEYHDGKFVAYDPATDAWTETVQPPANISVRFVAVAAVVGGTAYLGTGYANGTVDNKWYRLDVSTNTWTAVSNYPEPTYAAVAGVVNGKILLGGGTGADVLHEFDPAGNGTWTQKVALPYSMYHTTGFVLNDKWYVGLGYNQTAGGKLSKKFFSVDPQGTIASIADFPEDGEVAEPTFVLNGKAYVVGTHNRKLYRFTPDAAGGPGSWEVVMTDLPYALSLATVINGKIYIVDRYEQAFECILDY